MIYFILFFVIILMLEKNGGSSFVVCKKRYKNVYLWIFVGLFLLIGLRNQSVGTDTATYI